ncbi:hypothetical protein MTO96_034092 [Rhipicephalus appendiculatus]
MPTKTASSEMRSRSEARVAVSDRERYRYTPGSICNNERNLQAPARSISTLRFLLARSGIPQDHLLPRLLSNSDEIVQSKELIERRLLPPGYEMNKLLVIATLSMVACVTLGDMMRKSIVFDASTPKVFYCPQEKPRALDKMIVKARPVEKLCEFEGKGLPKGYKSDCYNDVDESEYACAEKQRIPGEHPSFLRGTIVAYIVYLRINPPNETDTTTTEAATTTKPSKKSKSFKVPKN